MSNRSRRRREAVETNVVSDQVVAATVDYERVLREAGREGLLEGKDAAFDLMMKELQRVEEFVGDPSSILGSDLTKHGEIAEHVTVGVTRARAALEGITRDALDAVATFDGVGRMAPEDYLVGGVQVQSKYINGTNRTLDRILEHLGKYPKFGGEGHIYHIPRDQYAQLEEIRRVGVAGMSGQGGPGSRSLDAIQRKIAALEHQTGRSFEELVQPGEATYSEVQQGRVHDTLSAKRGELSQRNESERAKIIEDHRPSLRGGAAAAAAGGAMGATMRVGCLVWTKMRQGKNPFRGQFDKDDWADIGLGALEGGARGAVTGGAVYALTNLARLSAPMAGATVSCASSVIALHSRYRSGEIDEEEFVTLSMVASLDVSMAMVGATMGQALIPIPVVGALIGSLGAKFVSSTLQKYVNEAEQELRTKLDRYASRQIDMLTADAKRQHAEAMQRMNNLDRLIDYAFNSSLNAAMRLQVSVAVAREMGVAEYNILHDLDEIDAFFMG